MRAAAVAGGRRGDGEKRKLLGESAAREGNRTQKYRKFLERKEKV